MWIAAVNKPEDGEYSHHQYLWSLFPESRQDPDTPRPFVFRALDEALFLLARERPATERAIHIGDRIKAGLVYQFNARCVAVRDGRGHNHPKGYRPRRPYLKAEERRAWFGRRVRGAEPQLVLCQSLPKRRFKRPNGQQVTLNEFLLTGALHVTDRAEFMECLQAGIGQGKAWGCGMIVLPEVMQWSR